MNSLSFRFNVIQYLRVLACLLVTLEHYSVCFGSNRIIDSIIQPYGSVTIFLVISGFLIFCSMGHGAFDYGHYIKKRAVKILPPYYTVLLVSLVFKEICLGGVPKDITNLGWLRYFFFLNMLVPARDFEVWNSMYGFWFMGCVPIFYLIAPFIKRYMENVKKCVILLVIMNMVSFAGRFIIIKLFCNLFPSIDGFANLTPIVLFYLFYLGMMAGYAYKNGMEKEIMFILGLYLLCALVFGKSGYILWGTSTAIIILTPFYNFPLLKNKVIEVIVSFLDENSFYVYLLHMLIYDIWNFCGGRSGFVGLLFCLSITLVVSNIIRIGHNRMIVRIEKRST